MSPRAAAPKKLSGAAGRKARKQRDAKATRGSTAKLKREWAELYKKIGPPPAEASERVEWGNLISAQIAYEQLVAPAIRTPQERKLVLEAVRTLGMTSVKSLYESKLRKLQDKVYGRRKASNARDELEKSD